MQCTAVYQKRGKWYLGWVEEIPGVNTQGRTLAEAKRNLKEALGLVLESYRDLIKKDRPRGKVLRQKMAF
ncbi:MAG: type II toxin-antitoxin system HicB family antitoxin [Patescibacteria group bacterium]|mgnify:CR=1 FL=1